MTTIRDTNLPDCHPSLFNRVTEYTQILKSVIIRNIGHIGKKEITQTHKTNMLQHLIHRKTYT